MGQKLGTFIYKQNGKDLAVLAELIESGHVPPAIDRTFALSEAGKAIQYVDEGHARGKVVISGVPRYAPGQHPVKPCGFARCPMDNDLPARSFLLSPRGC